MKTACTPSKRFICHLAVAAVVTLGAIALDSRAASSIGVTPPKTTSAPAVSAAAPQTPLAPSTAAQADEDIRDIRPPYHIPPGWLWLAWVGGGVFALAAGYICWRISRSRMKTKLPYEIALERLAAARGLMQPDQARAFSIAVSEVVRDYIETSFPVRAAHRTTNEFLHDLATRTDSPLAVYQPMLGEFLHHCDLAKFARWVLSVPEMEAMLGSASNFIVTTGKPAGKGARMRRTAKSGDALSSIMSAAAVNGSETLHTQIS